MKLKYFSVLASTTKMLVKVCLVAFAICVAFLGDRTGECYNILNK